MGRPDSEQKRLLKQNLIDKYETRKPERGTKEKGFLDYLALLERPSQAAKVGIKESDIGGNIFRSMGGVDLTPEEGFWTGARRGWMGEDEVRTQDFLPTNMDPLTKGVLGFAGDVATDPLTYAGPTIAKGAGKLISAVTPDVVKEGVKTAGRAAMDAKFGAGEYGLPDLARLFNVPVGVGRLVKGKADEARTEIAASLDKELADTLPKIEDYFKTHSKETGTPVDELKDIFSREAQRPRTRKVDTKGAEEWETRKDRYGNTILDEEGTPVKFPKYTDDEGNLLTLTGIAEDSALKLGPRGRELLDEWEGIGKRLASLSEAYGQPFEIIQSRGYWPGILTPQARKFVEAGADDFIESIDEFGQPIYRAGYKGPRKVLGTSEYPTVQAFNTAMEEKMALHFKSHGARPNPLDKPYEFFQTDPSIAMGMRWSRQNLALQRKWYIDEVTDAPRVTGLGSFEKDVWDWSKKGEYSEKLGRVAEEDGWVRTMFPGYRDESGYHTTYEQWQNFMNAQPVKPELGIGRWVKPDGEGGFLAKRANPAKLRDPTNKELERYIWEPISETDGFVEIKGIPRRFLPEDELDAAWVSAWTEQLRLRGLGRFHKMRFSDSEMAKLPAAYAQAKRVADAVRLQLKNDTNEVFMAPKQIARQVEDHLALMAGDIRSEKELANFLKIYDKIQNGWKAWTLGVRPAYHTRNAFGNVFNAYMVTGLGANIPEAIDIFTGAAKLQYYGRFGGSQARRDEFLKGVGEIRDLFERIPPKINPREWTQPNYLGTGYSMEEIFLNARNRGISAGHYKGDNIRQLEATLEARAGRGSKVGRILGPENPAVQAGFGLGGTIEGNARYAVFIHTLREIRKNPQKYKWTAPDGKEFSLSKPPKEYFKTIEDFDHNGKLITKRVPISREQMEFDIASMQVKGSQFDYMDVSKFERDALKRVMPFYTWTRKNLPVQLKHLILNPERAEKFHLAKEQFEHESGDLDFSDYGAFWGDRVPVFLGKETHGVIQAFTMLNILPMADLQRLLKPRPLLAEMVSPLIKVPLEQINNYDSFRKGKPITGYPNESKDYLGVKLSPRLWHLAQILVPLTEINRLNPAGVFGERLRDPTTGKVTSTAAYGGFGAARETAIDAPEIARWIRFFSGHFVYDVDLAKHRYIENRNIIKDMAELKGKIKWSAWRGQNEKVKDLLAVLDAVERQKLTDPFDRR
jgi:hypothetical protein